MNILNVTLAILGIVALSIFILDLCFIYREDKYEKEEFEKFLDSLKPGNKYDYRVGSSDNPFEEENEEEEITILEIRKNEAGETWVKIEFSDGMIGYSSAKDLYQELTDID